MPTFLRPSFHLRQPAFLTHLVALVFASVLLLASGQARAWSLDDVAGLAQTQAKEPFKPASHAVPKELANLDYDGYHAFP